MPGAPSSFLLLVVRPGDPSSVPGAPSSILAPSRCQEPLVAYLLLVVRPGAPSSVLVPSSDARSP